MRWCLLLFVVMWSCSREYRVVTRDTVVKPTHRQAVEVWVPTKVDDDGRMTEGVRAWVTVDETWLMVRE